MKKVGVFLLTMSPALILLSACSTGTTKEQRTSETTTIKEEINMDYKETKGQTVTYYTMNSEPIFGGTATIIEKNGKGLLVDTQFSKTDAEKIVQVAKDKDVDIETIYISYSDPDFYFGTDQIKKAFPKAKVVATAATIARIKDTYEAKLSVWSDTLKENKPDEIIIPEEIKDAVVLDGTAFTVFGNDTKKQTLYNKEDQLLLGGILVSTGSHLFMADTKTIDSQNQWLSDLDELDALQPKIVIPGHFKNGNKFSPKNIEFTKDYIKKFIEVESESQTSADIITKMKKAYPDLPDGNLEMSAKVVTGEMDWD